MSDPAADPDSPPAWRRSRGRLILLVLVVIGGVGVLGLLGTTLRPTAATVPTPAAAPVTGGYGTGIGMDALNNTIIGGPESIVSSYRFRATSSSGLKSIRLYLADGDGYASGTGGSMDVSVQTDDGSASHAPSGTVLASTSITPGNPISIGPLPQVVFPTTPALTAGQLYHIVFQNTDPSPAVNYVSLDGIYMFQPTSPRQPRFDDIDWGEPTRYGSGRWMDQAETDPILQVTYNDGSIQGEGHIQVWVGSPKPISGDASAREDFVVSGASRLVSSVAVRLTRVSGSGDLAVRLETGAGTVVEQGTILSSSIPIGIPGSHDGPGQATWATYTFTTARVLTSGQEYHLVLSAPADTTYSIYVLRKGTDYGFSPQTDFGDGHAQYNPGSGWVFFDQTGGQPDLDEGDLQFYFR